MLFTFILYDIIKFYFCVSSQFVSQFEKEKKVYIGVGVGDTGIFIYT